MPKDDVPDAPAPREEAKHGRWMRLALIVSVALNLAVAGVVAGALWHGGPPMRPPRDMGFGPFGEALSEADRRALRRAFHEKGPDMRAERQAMRDDMATLAAALRAEPLDPAALEAAFDGMSARMRGMLSLGETLIYEHAVALSPAERSALADRLDAATTRRGHLERRP